MSNQPEALRLADALEDDLSELGVWGQDIADSAAAELRRLHAVNQELLTLLKDWVESFVDCIEGGEADEMVAATRAAIAKAEGQA
jgi:hypothetical protein